MGLGLWVKLGAEAKGFGVHVLLSEKKGMGIRDGSLGFWVSFFLVWGSKFEFRVLGFGVEIRVSGFGFWGQG